MGFKFERDHFYTDQDLCKCLGMTRRQISAAVNAGELKATRRAKNRFFLGEWVIHWLQGNQVNQPEACAS